MTSTQSPTAEAFWPLYRDAIRELILNIDIGLCNRMWSSWKCWSDAIAIPAASVVCGKLGLLSKERLLRLDTAGYQPRVAGMDYNYDIRVAFEHENQVGQWPDELCKLCHVVADLRVLVAYYPGNDASIERLQERIDLMGDRMTRVRASSWLFIWGPSESSCPRNRNPWIGLTLDSNLQLFRLPDDSPMCPATVAEGRDAFHCA
jgi:hypothetical protein